MTGQYLRVEPTLETVVARFEGEDVTVKLETKRSSSVSVSQSDIGWIKVRSKAPGNVTYSKLQGTWHESKLEHGKQGLGCQVGNEITRPYLASTLKSALLSRCLK